MHKLLLEANKGVKWEADEEDPPLPFTDRVCQWHDCDRWVKYAHCNIHESESQYILIACHDGEVGYDSDDNVALSW